MIEVEGWTELRREHLVRGASIRELSRRTGHSRKPSAERFALIYAALSRPVPLEPAGPQPTAGRSGDGRVGLASGTPQGVQQGAGRPHLRDAPADRLLSPRGRRRRRPGHFRGRGDRAHGATEHERWNEERRRDGWAWAVERKRTPHLVPQSELPDEVKDYDRETVRDIPAYLTNVGPEVRRGQYRPQDPHLSDPRQGRTRRRVGEPGELGGTRRPNGDYFRGK